MSLTRCSEYNQNVSRPTTRPGQVTPDENHHSKDDKAQERSTWEVRVFVVFIIRPLHVETEPGSKPEARERKAATHEDSYQRKVSSLCFSSPDVMGYFFGEIPFFFLNF